MPERVKQFFVNVFRADKRGYGEPLQAAEVFSTQGGAYRLVVAVEMEMINLTVDESPEGVLQGAVNFVVVSQRFVPGSLAHLRRDR